MQYNRKIDVIIPAYNVSDKLLFRCLSSIASQSVIDDIKVTIVDDASTEENYQNIINVFSDMMDIQLLRMEENKGPGVARQYGIDHTDNEFITFIDADDTYSDSYGLRKLRDAISADEAKYEVSVGLFYETIENPTPQEISDIEGFEKITIENNDFLAIFEHLSDMIWVFAKLYRREFLEQNNIRFHPTSRANEDNGFNSLITLYIDDDKINYISDYIYYWYGGNQNSITRMDNKAYSYTDDINGSFYGYVENMIYAIEHAPVDIPVPKLQFFVCQIMVNLYTYYLECSRFSPDTVDSNFQYCKNFYKKFKDICDDLPQECIESVYSEGMKKAYQTNNFYNIIPHITFYQFLELCEEESD